LRDTDTEAGARYNLWELILLLFRFGILGLFFLIFNTKPFRSCIHPFWCSQNLNDGRMTLESTRPKTIEKDVSDVTDIKYMISWLANNKPQERIRPVCREDQRRTRPSRSEIPQRVRA
jgi:hypothetical protein